MEEPCPTPLPLVFSTLPDSSPAPSPPCWGHLRATARERHDGHADRRHHQRSRNHDAGVSFGRCPARQLRPAGEPNHITSGPRRPVPLRPARRISHSCAGTRDAHADHATGGSGPDHRRHGGAHDRGPGRPGQYVEGASKHSHKQTAAALLRMERGEQLDRTRRQPIALSRLALSHGSRAGSRLSVSCRIFSDC